MVTHHCRLYVLESTIIFLNCGHSPFNNPMETYRYYSLPFCHVHHEGDEDDRIEDRETRELPKGAVRHKQRMGESFVGDRRETSPYDLKFKDNFDYRVLCKQTLAPHELIRFKDVIHNNYFFEMFIEDLPMWGYIGDFADEDFIMGEIPGSKTFLFPHLHFLIGYNGNQIVGVKVTTDVSISGDRRCYFVIFRVIEMKF